MRKYIDKEALIADISETVIFSVRANTVNAEARGAGKVIDRIKSARAVDLDELLKERTREILLKLKSYGFYSCNFEEMLDNVAKEYGIDPRELD